MGSAGAIELIDFLRQKRLGWDITMANKAGFGGRNGRWTALVALFTATLVGLGTITSGDPYIAHIVGFLLTDETRHSVFATANIGVIVSMLVGGGIYALLTFGLNIALPGITSQPASTAKAQPLKPQRTL
jgi:hypothetical protein